MTPTLTKLEREALQLLIKFAWNNPGMTDFIRARALVIEALELDDDRPVDIQQRKDALNTFLATPLPQS